MCVRNSFIQVELGHEEKEISVFVEDILYINWKVRENMMIKS